MAVTVRWPAAPVAPGASTTCTTSTCRSNLQAAGRAVDADLVRRRVRKELAGGSAEAASLAAGWRRGVAVAGLEDHGAVAAAAVARADRSERTRPSACQAAQHARGGRPDRRPRGCVPWLVWLSTPHNAERHEGSSLSVFFILHRHPRRAFGYHPRRAWR